MIKRFTNHDDTILDTDGEQLVSTDEIADKMNELHEKNQNTQAVLNDFINICNRLQANPNDEQTLNVARDMLQNMNQELKE